MLVYTNIITYNTGYIVFSVSRIPTVSLTSDILFNLYGKIKLHEPGFVKTRIA